MTKRSTTAIDPMLSVNELGKNFSLPDGERLVDARLTGKIPVYGREGWPQRAARSGAAGGDDRLQPSALDSERKGPHV